MYVSSKQGRVVVLEVFLMTSSWLQVFHRTELLLHHKFLEIAFGASLDFFNDVVLDGTILAEEVRDAARMQRMFHESFIRDEQENYGRACRVWTLMMHEAFPELVAMNITRLLTYLSVVGLRWRT